AIVEDSGERLDAAGKGHADRVLAATKRMDGLIDDLLGLSRISRAELQRADVDLSALGQAIAGELEAGQKTPRRVELGFAPDVVVRGDPGLLRIALENLLGNAWKFTARVDAARVSFGERSENGERVFFVRDNGAGFDPAYASKLFGAFQRLYRNDQFEGN